MDKLRVAAAGVAERVARAGPVIWLRAVLDPRAKSDPKTRSHDAQRGQGLAEYALIMASIAIMAIVSLMFLGAVINGLFMDLINNGFSGVLEMLGI